MKNLKKVIVAASLCVAIGATAVAGTLAFFTDTDVRSNEFTVGDLTIAINEENWTKGDGDAYTFADATNVVPGRSVAKDPSVELVEGIPAYVSMQVSFVAKDVDQQTALDNLVNNGLIFLSEDSVTAGIDTAWAEQDNVYYYLGVLNEGEETPELFQKVILSKDLTTAQMESIGAGFDVVVTADAIQEEGLEAEDSIVTVDDVVAAFAANE